MAENTVNNPLEEYGNFPMPDYLSPYQEELEKLIAKQQEAEAAMNAPPSGFDKYFPAIANIASSIGFLADVTSGDRGRRARANQQYDALRENIKSFVNEKDAKKRQKFADKIAALDSEGRYRQAIAEAQGIQYGAQSEQYKAKVDVGERRKALAASKEPSFKDKMGEAGARAAEAFAKSHPELKGDALWKAFKDADPVNYGRAMASGFAPSFEMGDPTKFILDRQKEAWELVAKIDPQGLMTMEEKQAWVNNYLSYGAPPKKPDFSGIRNAPADFQWPGIGQGFNATPGANVEKTTQNMPSKNEIKKVIKERVAAGKSASTPPPKRSDYKTDDAYNRAITVWLIKDIFLSGARTMGGGTPIPGMSPSADYRPVPTASVQHLMQ